MLIGYLRLNMNNLLLVWILLTFPVSILMGKFFVSISKKSGKKEESGYYWFVTVLGLLIWWGIYFLIK